MRTDFQRHYEEIVAEYNREKDRVTIEQTFEALLKFYQELDEEEAGQFAKASTERAWPFMTCCESRSSRRRRRNGSRKCQSIF